MTMHNRKALSSAAYAEAHRVSGQVLATLGFQADERSDCTGLDTCTAYLDTPTASEVRQALEEAGFSSVVVREIRSTDRRGLLVAVPAGPACILALHNGDHLQGVVTGTMADGRCLEA
jgi:hypothetical protein